MPIDVQELATGVTRVVLSGRIDISAVQAIDTAMMAVAAKAQCMVIDLTGVEFIASMGLRSLVKCAKMIRGKRGHVALLTAPNVVADVIRSSGIDDLIPLFDSDAEALAAVSLV